MGVINLDGTIVGMEAEVDDVVFYKSSTAAADTEINEKKEKKLEDCQDQGRKLLHRGPVTVGVTIKIPYEPVDKVYFTPSFNKNGELVEVFITISKQSPTNRVTVGALARSISTGLKYGVPVEKFIKHFKGQDAGQAVLVRFPGEKKGRFIKSVPDLIGHALEYYGNLEAVTKLAKEEGINWFLEGVLSPQPDNEEVERGDKAIKQKEVAVPTISSAPTVVDPDAICPECGEVMVNEAGCWTCPACHYSKCG